MELWTEYEGRTIDGSFPLNKLVLPQGRSAFFSTANGKGEPILIRLVACHFDEEEILARWRGVQALNHPNFLRLERYGQLELDQTKVVYAAFERTDASLAQVVSQGCLTVTDARQLTESLASALQMLHANGFVHEHVEPEGVFAIGEVVKLRTDCIRETPEGDEGRHAKQRDVHDLAVVILQALTQERTLEAAAAKGRALRAPFDRILPQAMSGAWGLPEVAAALRPAGLPARTAAAPTVPPAVAPQPPAQNQKGPPPEISAKPVSGEDDTIPAALRHQTVSEAWGDEETGKKKWMGAAALAGLMLVLLWAGWSVYHRRAARVESGSAATAPPAVETHGTAPASAPAAASHTASTAHATIREQWRVVAYTYNHEDQARKKAAQLAQRHPALRPAVFSPNGHAPYLVTIGGALDKSAAYSLAHKAPTLGLPRDTFARNYKSSAH
jgi:eukaryotic-like serine/threonine-protein kinase